MALVLTRRIGEEIIITLPDGKSHVTIFVEDINGKQVKLGLNAPIDVKIDRKEIFERKQAGEVYVPNPTIPKKKPVISLQRRSKFHTT